MSDNLDELKGLVAAIKADNEAKKEKEKREAWTKFVALSMIFLAVLSAYATQRGGGFSSTTIKQLNEATFNQAEASDQWSFYQAKGIKQSSYELEGDRLARESTTPDAKMLAAITAKVAKYDAEKKEITAAAKAFEAKRDVARALAAKSSELGRSMGTSSTLFQIAISLGGVCLVLKKRWLWFVSLLLGVAASIQMIIVLRGA